MQMARARRSQRSSSSRRCSSTTRHRTRSVWIQHRGGTPADSPELNLYGNLLNLNPSSPGLEMGIVMWLRRRLKALVVGDSALQLKLRLRGSNHRLQRILIVEDLHRSDNAGNCPSRLEMRPTTVVSVETLSPSRLVQESCTTSTTLTL